MYQRVAAVADKRMHKQTSQHQGNELPMSQQSCMERDRNVPGSMPVYALDKSFAMPAAPQPSISPKAVLLCSWHHAVMLTHFILSVVFCSSSCL